MGDGRQGPGVGAEVQAVHAVLTPAFPWILSPQAEEEDPPRDHGPSLPRKRYLGGVGGGKLVLF